MEVGRDVPTIGSYMVCIFTHYKGSFIVLVAVVRNYVCKKVHVNDTSFKFKEDKTEIQIFGAILVYCNIYSVL